jgi:cobalamin synthase
LIALWLFRYHAVMSHRIDIYQVLIAVCLSRSIAITVGVFFSNYTNLDVIKSLATDSNEGSHKESKASHQLRGINWTFGLMGFVFSFLASVFLCLYLQYSLKTLFILTFTGFILASVGIVWLSKRSGGLNGDILGACACSLELLNLLVFLS